ncbi:hypothetical protein JMJ77_0009910, partial [Colletotrichum scovillei]
MSNTLIAWSPCSTKLDNEQTSTLPISVSDDSPNSLFCIRTSLECIVQT